MEETVWKEPAEDFAARQEKQRVREEQERLARQEAAKAEAEKKAIELEQNKRNAEWLANNYTIIATGACKSAVENLAKYDFEWTDGWFETKFGSYLTQVASDYVVTITGDKIKFQNGFGAWQKKQYYCDYDVKQKKALRCKNLD